MKYLNSATNFSSFQRNISNISRETSVLEGSVPRLACGLAFEETTDLMPAPLDLTVNTLMVKDRKLETPAKVKLIKLSENVIKDCIYGEINKREESMTPIKKDRRNINLIRTGQQKSSESDVDTSTTPTDDQNEPQKILTSK